MDFWGGSWLLQRDTWSCEPDESNKWFMLGRLAKGQIHRSLGFLETQLLSPSILEELSTTFPEAAENGTQKRTNFCVCQSQLFSIAGKWR